PNGNFPSCIVGQIYYDGAGINNIGTILDTATPCPDPSTTVPSGVSGPGGGNTASCHHGPIINPDGTYCSSQLTPPGTCFGAVPPNEYVIDGTSGKILATIDEVGGVDETWFNPTDNFYYLAARDMPNGPVLGIIDARTNLWLQNVPTNSNSHSVAVDSGNNHVFVPLQSG